MSGRLLQLIESFFRRRFWVVNLIGISIICFLMARGVNGILAANLAKLTVVAPVITETDDEGDTPARDDSAELISELLYVEPPEPDVVEEPIVEQEPEEEPEEEPEDEVVFESDCTQSNIPAILVGTNYDPRGDYLIGVVQDQTANRTVLVRPGMDLVGAQVIDVTRNRVWIYNGGSVQCLKPNEQPNTSLPVTPAEPAESETEEREAPQPRVTERAEPEIDRRPVRSMDDLESGVRRVSPTQYEIDRTAIDLAMNNRRMLQSQAPDFQQAFENGRPSGIRLTRLPAGSVFSAIGIRQGDVIMAVNGQRVTTPQRAMELYEALQRENHVEVTVQRRGRQRTLTYDIN